jgi:outer membrane immunogenic protein
MKKLLLSTAALALTTSAALAADLPTRKEAFLPPPPPPPMWTGFYAGLNAGYGFGTNDNTQIISSGVNAYNSVYAYDPVLLGQDLYMPTGVGLALSGIGPNTQSGFIGGGQIGYNYQYGSNIVLGIEADIQGTNIRGSSRLAGVGVSSAVDTGDGGTYTSSYNSIGGTRVNAGVDWLGTVRGRIGYLWIPTMLIYATGGLTYGGVYANASSYAATSNTFVDSVNFPLGSSYGTQTFVGGGSKSQTLVGWNIGGGLEWMFMPNWSLKAEGIYWNMGNMNVPTATVAAAPNPAGFQNVPIGPNGSPWWESASARTFGGTRVNYQGVIARVGVNYHFNFGGSAPIVAKY